ncbi:MAG: virulence RhuM family protein, partial [Bacteroidales bacterium]|nr:virulence RhuM family protein [Bacteroidales bacterium]
MKNIEPQQLAPQSGEVVLYNPNDTIRLEVRMNDETVWLSQAQMAELFGKDQSVIARHISNVFKEGEQDKESNMQILHNTLSKYKPTTVYSLDVIISVGYRVKSQRGVLFRKWANSVLKDYLLRGYAINHRFERIEQNIQEHFQKYDDILQDHQNKIDFFVRTALPPVEGIFFDGQIFDAYELACRLIKSAKHRIVLIDNYIDENTLLMLEKRNKDVTATIYTRSIG